MTDGDRIVDASVTNSFAHAAFRFGHSEINETTLLVNNFNQIVGRLSIRDAFFNPDFLKNNPDNVGRMLKGWASQIGQEVDLRLTDGIRNNLFGPPGAGGLDLGTLDIQRGRDHAPSFLPELRQILLAIDPSAVTLLEVYYQTRTSSAYSLGLILNSPTLIRMFFQRSLGLYD